MSIESRQIETERKNRGAGFNVRALTLGVWVLVFIEIAKLAQDNQAVILQFIGGQ